MGSLKSQKAWATVDRKGRVLHVHLRFRPEHCAPALRIVPAVIVTAKKGKA